MVPITELMKYGSRRKIEAIAAELGYPKANEYPEAVLEEVQHRAASQKQSVSEKAHTAADSETAAGAEEDLRYVQQAAENRAAGLLISLDALTMMHCASRQFTDPKLQQAVNDSQTQLKQMLAGVAVYYDPDHFLSPTPLAQITAGGNGSIQSPKSLNGKPSDSKLNVVEVVC
ncbi:hypothetical protein [Acaryochloris sp. IP29b_bin.137]|uniref:hypothetical protein n=1 Tax=Acaryochloris sp. IP29b_bin.137 TaxID=2969217 RepID=UPI0026165F17|nr:hypothetical protein [Acaryochloris sp. IP29b_bin.137]